MDEIRLGAFLRNRRERVGKSLRNFAAELNIAAPYLHDIEKDNRGVKCWIEAGGAHHTVLSTALTAQVMEDWCEMMQIECVHITKDTKLADFKKELFYNDIAWKLKNL